MDRRTLRVAVVTLLCIVALAAAAATLDTAQTTGGAVGPGSSNSPGVASGDDEGGSIYGNDEQGSDDLLDPGSGFGGCFTFLRSTEFILGALAVVASFFAVVTLWRNKVVAAAFVVSLGLPALIIYILLAACPEPAGRRAGVGRVTSNNASVPSGGGMVGVGSGTSPAPPSLVVLVVLGLVFVVAAGVVFRGTGDDEVELQRPEDDEAGDDDLEAIGRVAGETADRIDATGGLDNEVYRAWREMVDQLDVENPDATTPGEFADAATAAGMDRADVDELTDLFEAVRYGGVAPSADREERAVAALRRIERKYGGDSR